jgi:hypothetical protein
MSVVPVEVLIPQVTGGRLTRREQALDISPVTAILVTLVDDVPECERSSC